MLDRLKLNKFKVVFLGDSSVGKTSIVFRLTKDLFYNGVCQTIGASFSTYRKDQNYFELWDTAGQERFAFVSQLYYRDGEIHICVFDMSEFATVNRVINYIKQIKTECNKYHKFIIIGNKIDLIPLDELIELQERIDKRFRSYDIDNLFVGER
jgi:small GTP-binding protein